VTPRRGPAYRIETDRLVIRCWSPPDAPLLREAIADSLAELAAWMPWVHGEPAPVDDHLDRLRRFRGQFDLGHDYVYAILDPDETRVLGGSGLHPRVGPDAFEIGYWVRTSHAGQGIATEASAVLTRVGLEIMGADRIEIRVAEGNAASVAIPRKLGYPEEVVARRRVKDGQNEWVDTHMFAIFRSEIDQLRCVPRFVAFDAMGREVLRQ
jgi:RimJ/RimL family protein N-acetyltransferase